MVGKRHQAPHVVDGDAVAGRDPCDARIARGAMQVATGGARGERLRQRVLPPARTDEQDPHRAESTSGGAISAGGSSWLGGRDVVAAAQAAPRRRRHAPAAADVGRQVVGLVPAELIDAEAPERDDHGRERAAAPRQRVARAQRSLAVALARDETEILQPAQAACQQVGRDRSQRAGQIAVARDTAQQVADDQQRPAIADRVERRSNRAVGRIRGHGETLQRIVTRLCLVSPGVRS